MKINKEVSIIGAAGYSGEELIRLLLKHPNVKIKYITSRKYANKHIADVFPRFSDSKLFFSNPDIDLIKENSDAVFLALPHGLAAEYAQPLVNSNIKVFDLSADFRLKSLEEYKTYYKTDHPAPELLKKAVYGAPERYRNEIKHATLIACPGCYPTSITLPLCPLLKHELIETKGITVCSMSGVTGAGRKVDLPFTFPECNESVRAYAVSGHRHLPEIEQELSELSTDKNISINFIPHLMPINRGIQSTIIVTPKPKVTKEEIEKAFQNEYSEEPFIRILKGARLADTKNVTYTNTCEFSFNYDKHTGKLIINSAIDNLTKGASGQAIQCMNISFGFEESAGLK